MSRSEETLNEVGEYKRPRGVAGVSKSVTAQLRLFEKLVDGNASPETIGKMMETMKDLRLDAARDAFTACMSEMQPLLPIIEKNGTLVILNKEDVQKGNATPRIVQSTPFAKWEDIQEAIRPLLHTFGFTLHHDSEFLIEPPRVKITATIRHREGHTEKSDVTLPLDTSGSKNNVQAHGSTYKYGYRYSTVALLGIITRAKGERDDDGAGSSDAGEIDRLSPSQQENIRWQLKETGSNEKLFLDHMKVRSLADLPAVRFEAIRQTIEDIASRRLARENAR